MIPLQTAQTGTPQRDILSGTLLCDWRCGSSPGGQGGHHRSDQLASLARAANLQCVPAEGDIQVSRLRTWTHGGTAWKATRGVGEVDWLSRRRRTAGYWKLTFQAIQKSKPEIRCLLWEGTHHLAAKAVIAKEVGWRVIAVPQNLEALMSDRPQHRQQRIGRLNSLEREINGLAHADAIYCIGDEDAWFLRGLGIDAHVLPYFPAPELERSLLALRTRRGAEGGDEHAPIVMLGSLWASQLYRDMGEFLKELDPVLRSTNRSLVIVGRGTERALPVGLSSNITCLGWIEDAQLSDLLVSARALLVHQRFGSGALTRIPEGLLSGIPIISNRVAARSMRHYDGVYVYDDMARLRELLATNLPIPSLPTRPLEAEREFTEHLRRLAVDTSVGDR